MGVNACNAIGTGLSQENHQPPRFTLRAPHPNPRTGLDAVHYSLDRDIPVTIAVFDVTGGRIETLLTSKTQPPGPGRLIFDTTSVPSGVYSIKMTTESRSVSRKISDVK